MMYTTIVKFLLLVVSVAAAPTTTACNKDNCLRAVSGSAFPTRIGTSDCASYFLTTVTPATSTQTVTVTISPTSTLSSTITNTGTETDVATITNTATVVSDQTITSTATEIDIITDTVTIPATETLTITPGKKQKRAIHEDLRVPKITLAPRQATVVQSAIPSYASACSGSVRYSSACSCLGVTRSTTTAPTPITTKTVTATNFLSLVLTQTSSATATDLVTETDSATATSVVTETSVVTTTVDLPTTVSETVIVATQTAALCGPTPTLLLMAYGSGTSYDGQYAQLVNANDGLDDEVIVFTPSASSATPFQIDAAGHLSYNGYYANIDSGVAHFLFYFDTPATIASSGYVYATCAVDPTGAAFTCNDQGDDLFQISPSVQSTGDGGAGLVIGQYIESGNTPIFFDAICIG